VAITPTPPPIAGSDLANHIDKLIVMLQSPKASMRYDACEHLRVSPAITPQAIKALKKALKDSDAGVADAAKRALGILLPPQSSSEVPSKQSQPSATPHFSIAYPQDLHPNPPAPTYMPSGLPNTPEYIFALEKRIMILEAELTRLSASYNQAMTFNNSKFDEMKDEINEIPNSDIMSPNFLSRAFAVWGHYFVAQLIIAIPIYIIILLLNYSLR